MKWLGSRISSIKSLLYNNSVAYLLVVTLAVAAVFAAWLLSGGETVAFIYNEF